MSATPKNMDRMMVEVKEAKESVEFLMDSGTWPLPKIADVASAFKDINHALLTMEFWINLRREADSDDTD